MPEQTRPARFLSWSLLLLWRSEFAAATVMLAALPVILGSQLLLSFLNYDVRNIPQIPLQKRL